MSAAYTCISNPTIEGLIRSVGMHAATFGSAQEFLASFAD